MVDPANLAALVEQQNQNPFGEMPRQGDGDAEMDVEEEVSEKTPEERGKELLDSMGEFGADLRENAETLEGVAMEIGDGLRAEEPDEETLDAVDDARDRMPDELTAGMEEHLTGKSDDDLMAIGAALGQEQGVDGELVAMLLKYCCGDDAAEDEEEDLEDEEEDLEDEDMDEDMDELAEEELA